MGTPRRGRKSNGFCRCCGARCRRRARLCSGENPGCAGPDCGATAFGGCADCHAPGIDGALGGRDLRDATGRALDYGVHCDVCHRVDRVDLDAPAGVAGRLGLHRPSEKSTSIALGVWQKDRVTPGRKTFFLLNVAVAIWCVGEILELRGVLGPLGGDRVQMLGILSLPPLWLAAAARLAERRLAVVVDEASLDPPRLAQAIALAVAGGRSSNAGIDLDGADKTATLIAKAVGR